MSIGSVKMGIFIIVETLEHCRTVIQNISKMGKTQLVVMDNVCEEVDMYYKAADGELYTTGKKTSISKAEFTRVSEAWLSYAKNLRNQKDVAAITLVKPCF